MLKHDLQFVLAQDVVENRDLSLDAVDLGGDLLFLVQRDTQEIVAATARFYQTWEQLSCLLNYVVGRGTNAKVQHYYYPTRHYPDASANKAGWLRRHWGDGVAPRVVRRSTSVPRVLELAS